MEQEADQQMPTENPTVGQSENNTPVKPKKRKWLWWILVILLIAGAASASWYYYDQNNQNDTDSVDELVIEQITDQAQSEEKVVADAPIEDEGITWLAKPIELESQGLFKFTAEDEYINVEDSLAYIKYYKLADTSDGGMLVGAYVPPQGLSNYFYLLLKKDKAGSWSLYSKYSESIDNSLSVFGFDVPVGYSNTIIKSIDHANIITAENTEFTVTSSMNSGLVNDYEESALTKIANSVYGPILAYVSNEKVPDSEPNSVESQQLFLRRNDGRMITLKIEVPFLRDDHTLKLSVDGVEVAGNYIDEGSHSCGSAAQSLVVKDETAIGNKKLLAKYTDGSSVYVLNTNNEVTQYLYEQYQVGRDYPEAGPVISYEEFLAGKPVLVWQDGLGRWILIKNEAYGPLAECGKPAVYLYPTEPMNVSVKVGANVTVSEPNYGQGWITFAKPNGDLTVNGVAYPYLYWEGQGQGEYPNKVDEYGVVVPSNKAVDTIYQQMTDMGLTQKEQADFMEFWQGRLPSTPYTKLTWLTTREMNEIAPLKIDPKPDTVIRVFLDFEGLNNYQELKPQHFRVVPRNGFTVVEWGGLLRK